MTAPKPSSPGIRLDALTGLRWWAAFAVFGFHMDNLAPLPIQPVFEYGYLGVTFFFVLSGFVLTWSAPVPLPVTTFWWRRFARIHPAHIVALLAAIPVFYSFAPDPAQWWVKPFDLGVLLLSVVLLQGWSRDPAILFSGNPAAWTLSCEAFFYLLHPVLHRWFLRVRARGALLLVLAVYGLALVYRFSVILHPDSWLAGLPWPIVRLSEFVIGIGIGQAMRQGWRLPVPTWLWLSAGVALIGAFILAAGASAPGSAVAALLAASNEWVIVLCAVAVAAVATRELAGRPSLLRARPIVRLGEWSYAFYLVHATLIYAVLGVVGRQAGGWANLLWFAALLVASIAAAAALHLLIERPAERRLRKWWDSRRAAPVVLTHGN